MSSKVEMDAPRLWLVLSRCHRALNQIAERSIEDAGLCLTDFAALEALLHKGPLTITQIQSKVPLALGSMTAAVDRLEKKGLIMRTLMEQLTDEGAELVLVDGIKVLSDQGWALVVPDPAEPVTHVWAEGSDPASSENLVETYVERIAAMLP